LTISEFEENKISIYPNPAKDYLSIQFNTNLDSNYTIKIYNNVGQLVRTEKQNSNTSETTLSISDLSSGLYFIKFEDSFGFNAYCSKFIKD
jgi:hypothetical protein